MLALVLRDPGAGRDRRVSGGRHPRRWPCLAAARVEPGVAGVSRGGDGWRARGGLHGGGTGVSMALGGRAGGGHSSRVLRPWKRVHRFEVPWKRCPRSVSSAPLAWPCLPPILPSARSVPLRRDRGRPTRRLRQINRVGGSRRAAVAVLRPGFLPFLFYVHGLRVPSEASRNCRRPPFPICSCRENDMDARGQYRCVASADQQSVSLCAPGTNVSRTNSLNDLGASAARAWRLNAGL